MQLDEVALALLCDENIRASLKAGGEDPDRLTDFYFDMIADALKDKPADLAVLVHLCRGNYKGHWMGQGGYDPIAERLFQSPGIDGYLLEYDSERAGTFAPLRYLPNGKRAYLGVVSSKTGALEISISFAAGSTRRSSIAPEDRLGVSPQCGFASSVGGNPITEAEQWAKLAASPSCARGVGDELARAQWRPGLIDLHGMAKARTSEQDGGRRSERRSREPTPHVKQKQDRRRRAIMDAAAQVFAERGYFNATMKDIADRLGMRPASLYHYYPSKEAALEDMCRVSAVEFCERLRAILTQGGPASRDGARRHAAHLTSDRRAYVENFAFSRRNLPAGVLKELNTLARAYRQLWKKIFIHGADRGEWRSDLDPDVAADAVLALCNSAATTLPRRKNAETDAAMKWVELFLLGTRKR